MKKYNIIRELARNTTLSQNAILKEFRAKGHKIGNEKGRQIIREVRGAISDIQRERDEYIKEILKDDYNFREVAQLVRKKGYTIGNEELRQQYKKIRLLDRLQLLKDVVDEGRMQPESAKRIEEQIRKYYSTGQINKLNDLWGRLFDDENHPTFVDS